MIWPLLALNRVLHPSVLHSEVDIERHNFSLNAFAYHCTIMSEIPKDTSWICHILKEEILKNIR